jgi:ABC-type antimicrobial peptide transport system permease subunit
MRVTLLADLDTQPLGRIHRDPGERRPDGTPRDGLWIEQSGRELLGVDPGGRLPVRAVGTGVAALPVAGFLHDPSVAPSSQERVIYAYATLASAARLGLPAEPDRLLVRMQERSDPAGAAALGERLRDRLAASGSLARRIDVLPGAHPHTLLMGALLSVLAVVAAMATVCTAALGSYLVSTWIRREGRVVGILRAIGARPYQVALPYVFLVVPSIALAASVGVLAGTILGRIVARLNAGALNIDVLDWRAGGTRLATVLAVLLGAVLAGAGAPIQRASRRSVRVALHDPGIAVPASPGVRLASAARWRGSARAALAFRNTLRRPWRLLLMLTTLTAGGALLLATKSNYESLMSAIDRSIAIERHDLEVVFAMPVEPALLEATARGVANVDEAEAWHRAVVRIRRPGGAPVAIDTSDPVPFLGYPDGTRLFGTPLVSGRMPRPGSADEILVTRMIRDLRPEVDVGRDVDVIEGDRRATMRVVGIVDQLGTPALYGPAPAVEAVTGSSGASALRVSLSGADRDAAAGALDRALLEAHLPAQQLLTRTTLRDALEEHFGVVGSVLRVVALAAALLGTLVLGASTAFDVLDRRREIGVLRALGATRASIVTLFLIEASVVAIASSLLAVGLSWALNALALDAAARTLLHVAVPLRWSLAGLAMLGGGVLAVCATAWAAVALTLRESAGRAIRFEG